MISVKELCKMVEDGKLIREAYQRTPSHTETFASDVINSLINDEDIGNITLSYIDDKKEVMAILDGSSRLTDICRYIDNQIGYEKEVIEVFTSTSGETIEKSKKTKIKFDKLTEQQQKKLLNTGINCQIYDMKDINDRFKKFLKLNNYVPLSNIQKQKGLSSDLLELLNDTLHNSTVSSVILTNRAIQKDELYSTAVCILANIGNCYSGSNIKMLSDVKELTSEDVNINKVIDIINMVDKSINEERLTCTFNKYNLIHLVASLYRVDDVLLPDISIDNNIVPNIETKGANSKAKNEERCKKQDKQVKKAVSLALERVKANAIPVAPTEEVKELDLNQAL